MKKILVTIVCSIAFIAPNFAQESDGLKASKKNFSTELNVNLFQGELDFNNTLEQVKFRYFFSEQMALRIGFSADILKENREISQAYGSSTYMDKSDRKSNRFSINVGGEYHLKGTNRLSPYFGAELSFSIKNSSETLETSTAITEVTGAWKQYTPSGSYYSISYPERGYTSFGINLLAGFDFYIAKDFYVGYEFVALGLTSLKYKQVTEKTKLKSSSTPQPSTPNPYNSDTDLSFGPSLYNGIRIGYVF